VTEPTEGEGTAIWDRLRRRKVVQWGIAYAAGAWGFLQGLAYVSELLEWPAQLQKLTGLALLIGLPIALVLAWYHGDKGERRVTRTELAIITLLFLLGGGLFWRYQHTSETANVATSILPAADAGPSIAVLPFENRSSKSDDAFFVDGIHDDILTQLSKVSALKVISRTSVEQFRDTKLPIKEIAEQLGVKSILEGGVQRGGDRVRINVQLIDAGTDAHLWAETYDRALTAENIFAIQSDLSVAIAGALKTALTPAEKARASVVPTRSLEAWEAYQLGKQRQARRASAELAEAEKFFGRAIELDPTFALAYVGLADTLSLETDYSDKPPEAALAEADGLVSKALALDANLAEAWASKGGIAISRAQVEQAEKWLRRAIELNPNYAPAHHWLGIVLSLNGSLKEGLEHSERAAQLDPLSVIVQVNLGNSMQFVGRFDEAATRYRRALDIDPMSSVTYDSLAALDAYARNRFADAVTLQERAVALDSGSPTRSAWLSAIYLDVGDVPRAQQVVASLIERWPDDYFSHVAAAVLHQVLGSTAAAERHASKALAIYPIDTYSLQILRNADLRQGDPGSARARYASAFPELLTSTPPSITAFNHGSAIDVIPVLQAAGDGVTASALLDLAEQFIRTIPRLGVLGYGIADVAIHALRGDKDKALAALREAEKAGWRGPFWRYYRDIDPNLASIRNEPEFKAVFADIERDMAHQRAELAARSKDAPLDLKDVRK